MATSKLLDRFDCRDDLPGLLWKVQDSMSQAAYLPDRGLTAENDYTPETTTELRESVEKHLDWKNQDYSPFLSVFSDHRHSSKWAILRQADLE